MVNLFEMNIVTGYTINNLEQYFKLDQKNGDKEIGELVIGLF